MRIEELSVGDWVCAKLAKWESGDADMTPPLQVKRINGIERHNLYVELFNPTNNTIEHSAFVEDLIPIPITPEILEKNGINKTYDSDEYAVYKGEGFNVNDYYTELWEFSLRRNRVMLKNVHELQHALRLAGIEKEIEV